MENITTVWTKILAKKVFIFFVLGVIVGTIYGRAMGTAALAILTNPDQAMAKLQVETVKAEGK